MTLFDNYSNERITIENIYNYLEHRGGIRVLSSNDIQNIKKYEEILNEYYDLRYFEMLNGDEQALVIRFKEDNKKINVSNLIKEQKDAFEKGKYKYCIIKGLNVLKLAEYPKEDIYARIGLSYYENKNLDNAEIYLRVACFIGGLKKYNELNMEEMVEIMRNKINKEKNIKNNDYSFFNNMNKKVIHIDGLEVDNFDKIINYIKENNIDLETAGKELNLSNEEIDFIKLIYAREFYKQGDIEKGNYYLNSVEKTSGKTSDVVRLCFEARTNKKFFQYREDNNPKKLTLIKTGNRK